MEHGGLANAGPPFFVGLVSRNGFLTVIIIGGGALKQYFVGGREITEAEAKEIEAKNQDILRSGSIEQLLKIQLVICRR